MTATPRCAQRRDDLVQPGRLGQRQARRRLVHDEQRAHSATAPSRSRRAAAARSTARPPACPARRRARAGRGTAAPSSRIAARSISRSGPQRVGSRPSRTLPATSRLSSRFSSWWMKAMPSAVARVDVAHRRRGAPSIEHLTRVGLLDAADDLHQRGLAGAVLAEQRDDFSGVHVEAHAAQRVHARKALLDAPKLEDRRAHDVGPAAASAAAELRELRPELVHVVLPDHHRRDEHLAARPGCPTDRP